MILKSSRLKSKSRVALSERALRLQLQLHPRQGLGGHRGCECAAAHCPRRVGQILKESLFRFLISFPRLNVGPGLKYPALAQVFKSIQAGLYTEAITTSGTKKTFVLPPR